VHAGTVGRCAVDCVTAPALAKYASTSAAVAVDARAALIALAKYAEDPVTINGGAARAATLNTVTRAALPENADAAAACRVTI